MKKIFKGLSVLVASTALCAGIATATACSGGYNGTYTGEYHYIGGHSATPYGMVVEVEVNNNIIVSVKNITNTEASKNIQTYKDVIDGKEAAEATYHQWTVVSPGWGEYSQNIGMGGQPQPDWYGWSDNNSSNWTDHESWLLQQYVGWSVADVLAIEVYTDYGYTLVTTEDGKIGQASDKNSKGEPYGTSFNAGLNTSGLLISGATQGSGRLLLAVQDALKK
ncbi:MAG: hypothetical protein K2O89_01880 [Clostridia bacterium]|nr:hypothetical protein [Clostridia bacterium]